MSLMFWLHFRCSYLSHGIKSSIESGKVESGKFSASAINGAGIKDEPNTMGIGSTTDAAGIGSHSSGVDSCSPGGFSRDENCMSEDNDTMDTGLGTYALPNFVGLLIIVFIFNCLIDSNRRFCMVLIRIDV